MTAVLTQVGGDPDGAATFGGQCGHDGVRFNIDRGGVACIARLPHGGNVVDIDA